MRKLLLFIMLIIIVSNVVAQAPPPTPIEPNTAPIGDNLLFLLIAGLSYGFKKYQNLKKQISNKI